MTQTDRWFFSLAAIWNLTIAALFLFGEPLLRDLFGFPVGSNDLFTQATAALLAVFGLGYYWVGRDPTKNHALIGLGALGNILIFGLALAHAIAGPWPYALPVVLLPDVVFAAFFGWFLLSARSSPAAVLGEHAAAPSVESSPPAAFAASPAIERAALADVAPVASVASSAPPPGEVPVPAAEVPAESEAPLATETPLVAEPPHQETPAVLSLSHDAAPAALETSHEEVPATASSSSNGEAPSATEPRELLEPAVPAAALDASVSREPALDDGAGPVLPQPSAATPAGKVRLLLQLLTTRVPSPTFEVTKSGATVGRGPENTIRLEDLSVSRRHARISYRQGGYWIVDLGSTSGTWIDGIRLKQAQRIAAGQIIDIGICRMTTTFASDPEAAPARKAASKSAEVSGRTRKARS